MVQLLDEPDAVEVAEIQIESSHQNKGIGSRILLGTLARAHERNKPVRLSVGLKNIRALRLYIRLAFEQIYGARRSSAAEAKLLPKLRSWRIRRRS